MGLLSMNGSFVEPSTDLPVEVHGLGLRSFFLQIPEIPQAEHHSQRNPLNFAQCRGQSTFND